MNIKKIAISHRPKFIGAKNHSNQMINLDSVTFTMDLGVHSLDQLPYKPKKVTQLKHRPCSQNKISTIQLAMNWIKIIIYIPTEIYLKR